MSKTRKGNGVVVSEEPLSAAEERMNDESLSGNGGESGGMVPKIVKSRRERFLSQVIRRMNNALKRLEQVENLGNRASYEATDQEYAKVLSALGDALNRIRMRFSGKDSKREMFTL